MTGVQTCALPIFDNADAYIESVAKLAQVVKGTDVKKVLAQGDDVVTIYDLQTNTPAGTSHVAEWATVEVRATGPCYT